MCEFKKCVVQESGPCALSHTRADLVGRDAGELAEGISAGELTPFPLMPQQQSGEWALHLAWAEQ